jgi:hypothetical protein
MQSEARFICVDIGFLFEIVYLLAAAPDAFLCACVVQV